MTAIELIDQTVEYYKTHDRGLTKTGCGYLTDEGSMCAVGRCLSQYGLENYGQFPRGVDSLICSMIDDSNAPTLCFKPEYHNLIDSPLFCYLQRLHDDTRNWNKTKNGNDLTTKGKKVVNGLKVTFGDL